jgi:hypothetical protein
MNIMAHEQAREAALSFPPARRGIPKECLVTAGD